ncbi:MAG: DNA topoisomerase I [Candidatus Thermoplasmatota archaeon]|nr:DNA topoisomerase I [Candidatus Thermoplasmatota archaeon]
MRRLIITEKNHAARRIALILSDNTQKSRPIAGVPVLTFGRGDDEYFVLGLRGHIILLDYPDEFNQWDTVPPRDLVYAKPEKKVDPSARKIMNALKDLATGADEIIVATDYDREGELIGAEAIEEAEVSKPIRRAKFSALTKAEIERAFSQLADLDYRLSSAAETRQLIDLAWGASLTRFISLASGQLGKEFLSVGRVQSPTLALIVDREREIEAFKPTPYWLVTADLRKEAAFKASHKHGRFLDKDEAHSAAANAKKSKQAIVNEVSQKENEEWAPPPFSTTIFQIEANKLGLTPAHAMKIAEDLYTNGYISYPRTDNTVYPPSLGLKNILEKLRKSEFAKEAEEILAQETLRPSRGKKSTTDHPPIHPVDAATKGELKGHHWNVYELVTRRFLATLAPACRSMTTNVDLEIGGEPFTSEGYRIIYQGWRKYYPYYKVTEIELPPMTQGDAADVIRIHTAEKKTTPPDRYSQGSLIRKMEDLGLGTKSTRHETIQKLYDRKFVKGNRIIEPTESGVAVITALEKHANDITNVKMTSHLESDMDMIAAGELEQAEVVEESQAMLDDIMTVLEKHKKEVGDEIKKALREQHTLGRCPVCKSGMLTQIRARNGGSFAGCSNYPECKNAYPLPFGMLVLPTDAVCEVCGAPKVKTVARGQAPMTVCIDPKCKGAMKERFIAKCGSCGGNLSIIQSKKGKRFVGCSNYPKCNVIYPLPQQGKIIPTGQVCDACGSPVIQVLMQNRGRWTLCLNMKCPKKAEKKAKKKSGPSDAEGKDGPSKAG